MLDEAVLGQALELLRLLRALRCRGGDVIAAWEALPLECLLMLVSASARAQTALEGFAGGHNGILVSIPLSLHLLHTGATRQGARGSLKSHYMAQVKLIAA